MKYLKLIRWPYLLLIILSQFLIKYTFFEPFDVPITLNWIGLSLLSLATICLAAAGFIIDSIYNVEADKINHPNRVLIGNSISVKKANKLFFILNIIGIIIGFYLSNIIGQPSFAILFIGGSFLLYGRATSLKKYALLAPIINSLTLAASILLVGLYDLFPAITDSTRESIHTFFSILLDYALFIALLNFVRELIIRQRNIDGDYKMNRKSIPLMLGKGRSNTIILILSLLPIAGIIFYLNKYLYMHLSSMLYTLIFILAPLLFAMIKIMMAKHKSDYALLNTVLKIAIFFSILSFGLYQFILP